MVNLGTLIAVAVQRLDRDGVSNEPAFSLSLMGKQIAVTIHFSLQFFKLLILELIFFRKLNC